jgi:nitric oxide reductase NorD protein
MAEAEDVITDAARHATVFVRALWRRHRPSVPGVQPLQLAALAPRLDLLATAIFQRSFVLRVAQTPAAPTWLNQLFLRGQAQAQRAALPATDGLSIWLPASFGLVEPDTLSAERYRIILLMQAMRAQRGMALLFPFGGAQLLRALCLVLEARAADEELVRLLPGMAAAVRRLRAEAMQRRPPLSAFAPRLQALERLTRAILGSAPAAAEARLDVAGIDAGVLQLPATAAEVLLQAQALHQTLAGSGRELRGRVMWTDWWSGELQRPQAAVTVQVTAGSDDDTDALRAVRSARLLRRPKVRQALEDEDAAAAAGPTMVQTAQPHEQAEDPVGMQRPTDRDTETAADDFADALSELNEARLVSTPGRPREILLSDDPPEASASLGSTAAGGEGARWDYPEWDWRAQAYLEPGATVRLSCAAAGPQQWVDQTLAANGAMLHEIRRRFELLRAERTRVRKQLDGDDIDLQAWLDSESDFRAGLPLTERLYQDARRGRRDMAITLLVDVSGSTDGWIADGRRVIDVEREALLLVCIALDGMDERFSVLTFSGEGPDNVAMREVKHFDERYDNAVARRIAGLEPEKYTRAGAAIRHASAQLMQQAAAHRLLLLLSDGKPNDVDEYDGRYGVEDMGKAVSEARLQGIAPFCLTIDRHAANYLPRVFGQHQYALLPRPELLPAILLDWMRRLMAR